jgi:hypothetical protein
LGRDCLGGICLIGLLLGKGIMAADQQKNAEQNYELIPETGDVQTDVRRF